MEHDAIGARDGYYDVRAFGWGGRRYLGGKGDRRRRIAVRRDAVVTDAGHDLSKLSHDHVQGFRLKPTSQRGAVPGRQSNLRKRKIFGNSRIREVRNLDALHG